MADQISHQCLDNVQIEWNSDHRPDYINNYYSSKEITRIFLDKRERAL